MTAVDTLVAELAKNRSSKRVQNIRAVAVDMEAAFEELQTQSTPGQLPGTTTNDNANPGNVGEYISSVIDYAGAVTVNVSSKTVITSINLTPGDWDVFGSTDFTGLNGGAGNSMNIAKSAISKDNSSYNYTSNYLNYQYMTAPGIIGWAPQLTNGPVRISLNVNQTMFLIAFATFTTQASIKAFGYLRARRVR